QLSHEFFGSNSSTSMVDDLLELHRIWTFESDWYWSSPLLEPDFFRQRAKRLDWSFDKLADYRKNLERLRQIAARYADAQQPAAQEMARLAKTVVTRWGDVSP